MKIYLAARYSRRLELCEYRKALVAQGHTVTSRWLNGTHQISDRGTPLGDDGENLVEGGGAEAAALRAKFAEDDLRDVNDANLLIAFTEPPRSAPNRGGRHVELGIALGNCIPVIVVGHRENIFCWLPEVEFFESFDQIKIPTSCGIVRENTGVENASAL